MLNRICKPTLFIVATWFLTQNSTYAFRPISQACGQHGTTVEFAGSLAEAAKQATQEEKLVFVLHVSGHFEKPEFT